MKERWKAIPGFAGYEASDLGRIRSFRSRWGLTGRPRILAQQEDKRSGHVIVRPRLDGARRTVYVSRLVCLAWCARPVGARIDRLDASHLDGDAGNNRAANLKFEDRSANLRRLFMYHGFARQRAASGQFAPDDEPPF